MISSSLKLCARARACVCVWEREWGVAWGVFSMHDILESGSTKYSGDYLSWQ
jgi:hypothetical protein